MAQLPRADGAPILAQLPSQQQILPPSPPAQNPASYNHELSDGQLACSPGARPVPCQHILAPSPPARNPASYAHALPGEQLTCGPRAQLTGSLHEGGLRSVHSLPQRRLHAPNTASGMHTLSDGWSILCYITSNDSHVQMIRQGGTSESESIWNAIDFLQRAFQDQPELFGSRGIESLNRSSAPATLSTMPSSGLSRTPAMRLPWHSFYSTGSHHAL